MRVQIAQVLMWWAARAAREQLLLVVMFVAITLWLGVVAVWQPLQAARARLGDQVARYERALTVLTSQPIAATPTLAPDGRPLNVIITETAAAFQLTIRRLEPEGARIRVVLEDVPFDSVILWLDAVQRDQALSLTEVEITRRPAPGTVNAVLALER